MELNDAISHAREKAEEQKKKAERNIIETTKEGWIRVYDGKEYNDCLECAKEHEQLAEWLTELKERREADRWIPVSEKLPDEYGNYLVFTSDNDTDIGTFNPQFDDSWSLCDANGFYWARQKGIKITHWKPLPKPYKESEDNNG